MKQVHFRKHIRKLCRSLMHEMGDGKFKDAKPSSQNMENKLLKPFGN